MDEMLKNLQAILDYMGSDAAKRQEVIDAIHSKARQEIWQPIATKAFTAGKSESATSLGDLETKFLSLQGQLADAQNKVREYETKAPGSKDVVAGLEKKVLELQEQNKSDRAKMKGTLKGALKTRDISEFEKQLVAKGMDERFARAEATLLAERMDYVDGEGENALPSLRIYQSAQERVPITVPNGGDVIATVVADSLKAAPPAALRSKADTGGGARPADSHGAQGSGSNIYDKIREEKKGQVPAPKADIVGAFMGNRAPAVGAEQ